MKVEKVENEMSEANNKVCMHISCLFVICIIIKDTDNIQYSTCNHINFISPVIHGSNYYKF